MLTAFPQIDLHKLEDTHMLKQYQKAASPSAIGVKALKPSSVLALSPISGQENPTQKASRTTKKRWFVPGLKSPFVSIRSSID